MFVFLFFYFFFFFFFFFFFLFLFLFFIFDFSNNFTIKKKEKNKKMGSNLPNETLQHIFGFISQDDIRTLHSIILVNKTWCVNGIKFLWRNPLEYDIDSINQSRVINVLLTYLNSEKLSMMNDESEEEENNDAKNLFNYPSFITHLNFSMVVKIVWNF